MGKTLEKKAPSQKEEFRKIVLEDFKLATISRETSLLGRREVLTGKAKFGIFGDGKEVAQIAWAKAVKKGDFRSGYYRDQTFMMAIGALTVKEFFASLYANTDVEKEPASAGRQMNGHFATRSLNADGSWKNLMEQYNVSADISPTAGQMPRLVGLAEASKHYRVNKDLHSKTTFSNKGNEVAWGTIGNASTSEGPFFEAINAAGVLQVPMVMSVWDDEYGISVHAKYQTTKESISEILAGFQRTNEKDGYEIMVVKGWDYPTLIETYEKASALSRKEHVPVLIHVNEMTQPQGHSTSGSHERYKSPERLQWEQDFDCIKKLREFIETTELATADELDAIVKDAKKEVKKEVDRVYENDRFLIIRPLSHKSSCYYGASTKWCTTSTDNDDYFNRYTSRGKLYYIIDKKSSDRTYGKMALLVPHGNGTPEVYNQQDHGEKFSFLLERFAPIKEEINKMTERGDDYETLKKVKNNL